MRQMKSPEPNRRGEYEVHDVPERRVESYRARGWVDAQSAAEPAREPIASGLVATHRGGGYYRVTDATGALVEDSVRRERAEELGAL